MVEWLFGILLFAVFYTYLGYPAFLWIVVRVKRITKKPLPLLELPSELPDVCLFVTACNEREQVGAKVANSLQLAYPKEKLQLLWVTDGSTDGTPDLVRKFPEVRVEHLPERRGKAFSMNRGMQFVKAPIVIFSDANTMLSPQTVIEIVRQFQQPDVGCIAGEKRVLNRPQDGLAANGESFYWRFESQVKRWDAELSSAIGAAGELFAIRRELFLPVEPDTILDDFVISMRLVEKGFRISYLPEAYATETASLNLHEEYKRKVRIAAGGVQALVRLLGLLNPFRFGWLSWQFFSHKVLRWTLTPIAFFAILPCNIILISYPLRFRLFYIVFLAGQILFYLLAGIGWRLQEKLAPYKIFYIPAFAVMANFAAINGMTRFFRGRQNAAWERSRRA